MNNKGSFLVTSVTSDGRTTTVVTTGDHQFCFNVMSPDPEDYCYTHQTFDCWENFSNEERELINRNSCLMPHEDEKVNHDN